MSPKELASALGKLGLGRKKTMTPEAIEQRIEAAKISALKRKGRKRVRSIQEVCQSPQITENK